jgi:hypothetical protein
LLVSLFFPQIGGVVPGPVPPEPEPELALCCVPVPLSETDAGEFVALLITLTLPLNDAADPGVNITFNDAVCPGVNTCPDETPLAVYPEPDMLTLEIVTLPVPPFVNVTGSAELAPTLTLPKLKFDVLEFNK